MIAVAGSSMAKAVFSALRSSTAPGCAADAYRSLFWCCSGMCSTQVVNISCKGICRHTQRVEAGLHQRLVGIQGRSTQNVPHSSLNGDPAVNISQGWPCQSCLSFSCTNSAALQACCPVDLPDGLDIHIRSCVCDVLCCNSWLCSATVEVVAVRSNVSSQR
jgi:hypothetical protein